MLRLAFIVSQITTFVFAFTMVFAPAKSRAAVWESTSEWNDAAEQDYRQWVVANWNKYIFERSGPQRGISVDCADVVYSMRILFASQRGLPFAMKDPTTRAGTIISNAMTRWDSLPTEQRIRKFLLLVFSIGSTASLPADTYPTAINSANLGPGSLILSDKKSHHSWTIQNVYETGIPNLLFGSRPAGTLLYEQVHYPSTSYVFPNGIRAETHAGFRNFRQPKDIGKPVDQVTGFSLEQYDFAYAIFMQMVQTRIQQVVETDQQRVKRLYGELCKAAKERVEYVQAGIRKSAELGPICMNATQYDDFSTPNRDQRFKDGFLDLAKSFRAVTDPKALNDSTRQLVESVLDGANSAQNSKAACPIEIGGGQILTLGQIYSLSVNDKLSNNPHDSLEMRWGLAVGPSVKASACPTY